MTDISGGSGSSRKKEVMKAILRELSAGKEKIYRIEHRKGWLAFLQNPESVILTREVRQAIRKIIDTNRMRPRGRDLLKCRKRFNFTMRVDKAPYRVEEGLERLIIAANVGGPDYEIFDQIPIGGGKESVDLGVRRKSKFTLIELKAWESSDSPIYALIEILKNLIEYEIILDLKMKEPLGEEIELAILAPKDYYIFHGLLDAQGMVNPLRNKVMGDFLKKIAAFFQTKISFMSLDLNLKDFKKKCVEISAREGLVEQRSICCNENDCLPALKAKNWKLIVSSA